MIKMPKGVPKRDGSGKFARGHVPANKIVLPESELRNLYKQMGASKIAQHFGVSKSTVLRNLHEYNIPMRKTGAPSELPRYWKNNLRKPKSTSAWNKGLTKEVDERVKKISDSLKGEENRNWKPEIHAEEFVECLCGCGQLIQKYDKRGRRRYYVKEHCTKGCFKKGNVPWNKGKRWDSETVQKILTIRAPNKEEKYLIDFFEKHNLPYRFVGDGKVVIEGRNPDFINCDGQKKIIEFFGEHWHEEKDEEIKRQIYERYGYKLLVLWGKDLKDEENLLNKVLEFNRE